MTSTIALAFPCTVCGHEIRGVYEEEDFDYPVFCPKCGRQNRLPAQSAPSEPVIDSPPEPIVAARPLVQEVEPAAIVPSPPPELKQPDIEIVSRRIAPDSSAEPQPPASPRSAPEASAPTPEVVSVAPPVVPAVPRPAPVVVTPSPEVVIATPPPAPRPTPPAVMPTLAAALSPPPITPPQPRGRTAWRFRQAASLRPVVALRNCVAVDDRGRIIAALGPELFALSAGTAGCEVDWKFTAGEHIPGSPVIGPNGTVYVHSSDGNLHAIDAAGTPTRPPTRVGPALGWATPLVDESERVWICNSTGGLVRVDATGQTSTRPFFRHPSRFDCTGALRGSVLFLGSEDQFLHAIDLQGERGRDCWDPVKKIGLTGWYINSAIALAEGARIVAVSRDDLLYLFDENGGVVWKMALNGRAIGSPVVAPNGLIVIGLTTRSDSSDALSGRLLAVHGQTGQQSWKVDFEAPLESTPVVGDANEIYVGDNSGKIHAVTTQGQRVWSEMVGSSVRSAGTILASGQVVFGLDDGSLVALRCASQGLAGPWPKLLATPSNRCPSGC